MPLFSIKSISFDLLSSVNFYTGHFECFLSLSLCVSMCAKGGVLGVVIQLTFKNKENMKV